MCNGVSCSVKLDCFRHIAKPTPLRQTYFITSPGKDGSCEYFLPVTEDEKQKFHKQNK